jgi:hypothetical protein
MSAQSAAGARLLRTGLLVTAAALSGACTTTTSSPSAGGDALAAVAPALSVERFLQAVNAKDLDAMARLFGTPDGPIRGERTEIEIRMDAIARILEHQDYRIVRESDAPGREVQTRRVGVDLTIGGEVVRDVAFHVVQTREGRWMVQEIDLEAVTNR